mgnify:CR=1 FL=1
MNVKLKLDTTILQSNTSMHLVQYIIEQRNAINALLSIFSNKWVMQKIQESDLTENQIKELNEDFEYIMKKHADALHKRCNTNIYSTGTDDDNDYSAFVESKNGN